ncbi:patatin-like phospholipase family protein [Mycobacterium koreense]|uniref:Patatin n=1 Tax=Mycolicibacillus koreensis TaxID=1069220 RepID=A0A7I7SJ06_9MYCO|nr:patatin-like phospholipase family protein [Mycolicibacillus koreensis]MCV7249642.1 patatin-like phospholipase family protein [Mycolicibacillus koreensis]OSC31454.1 patatin [Mycolicibacillus koreensis]BBY56753.1 hypothetical protein MKOR_40040 [Mycolicibacillus koreensis]
MTRALVLGGGGVAGIAWETGVLRGIADESPELADVVVGADVLVGTSAGSAVSAQLSSGCPLTELYERQVGEESAEIDPGVSGAQVAELFLAAMVEPDTSVAQKLQGIGEVAVNAETVSEPVRRAVIAARLPDHGWGERDLRITAVDVATGTRVVFDRRSGVALVDAVAASCAVPGVWPPVTIGDRRYMDGGVGSTVNVDVAEGCSSAVVLVPTGESAPSPFGPGPADEIAAFTGRTFAVFADDASLASFGSNLLDPASRIGSARAGRVQGRRLAADLAAFLRA